jgi:hypothetical protein
VGCYDETNIVPYAKTTVPQDVPEELTFGFTDNYTTDVSHGNGLVQWLVNGNPMAIDLDHPTLEAVIDGDVSFGSNRHVFEVDEKHKVNSIACQYPYLVTNNHSSGNIG